LSAGEEAVILVQALLNRDAGNLRFQRDLSIMLYYVGHLRGAQGKSGQMAAHEEGWSGARGELEQALAVYEESSTLARALLNREHSNAPPAKFDYPDDADDFSLQFCDPLVNRHF
jgi:hypothetical protein